MAEIRLAVLEHRVGTGPDTSDLDEQIAQVRREKESAVDARDYEQAAARRNREQELLAAKAARQEQRVAGTRRCRLNQDLATTAWIGHAPRGPRAHSAPRLLAYRHLSWSET